MSTEYTTKLLTEEDEHLWEKVVLATKPNLFVRSSVYGKFHKNLGYDYHVLGLYADKVLIGGAMFVDIAAKRGRYLYAPYGPILDYKDKEMVDFFFEEIKKFAKEQKVDFVKVSPFLEDNKENNKLMKRLKLTPSPLHALAETTWMLDITPEKEDIMKNMRQNHRNLTRRAERDGVTVEVSEDEEALEHFFPLFNETAKRHNFTAYSEKYIRSEFNTFQEYGLVKVFNAFYEGEVLSSAIVYFYGNMAVYRHGASTHKNSKIPTSYAIQWAAIQEAKEKGCEWYNFWGIAPDEDNKKHPFWGITRFKKGFGGERRDILHCHDMPITWKYWFNYAVERFRKWRRGF